MLTQVFENIGRKSRLALHRHVVASQKIRLLKLGRKSLQLSAGPPVLSQALIDGLQGQVENSHTHELRDEKGFRAQGFAQPQSQQHIGQGFIRLAVLKFRNGSQAHQSRACLAAAQMRQVEIAGVGCPIIHWKPRAGQAAGAAQFLNRCVVFAQGQQHIFGGRPRPRRNRKQVRPGGQVAVIRLQGFQIAQLGILPEAQRPFRRIAAIHGHAHPVRFARARRLHALDHAIPIQDSGVTGGNDGRHSEVLVVGDVRWSERRQLKAPAERFLLVSELVPGHACPANSPRSG